MPREKSRPKPPPEILQFVRSLAIDDARRDHEEEMERLRRRRGETMAQKPAQSGRA